MLSLSTPGAPPPVEECGYHLIPLDYDYRSRSSFCPQCREADEREATQAEERRDR